MVERKSTRFLPRAQVRFLPGHPARPTASSRCSAFGDLVRRSCFHDLRRSGEADLVLNARAFTGRSTWTSSCRHQPPLVGVRAMCDDAYVVRKVCFCPSGGRAAHGIGTRRGVRVQPWRILRSFDGAMRSHALGAAWSWIVAPCRRLARNLQRPWRTTASAGRASHGGSCADSAPERPTRFATGAPVAVPGPRHPGVGIGQWTTRDRRAGLFRHVFRGPAILPGPRRAGGLPRVRGARLSPRLPHTDGARRHHGASTDVILLHLERPRRCSTARTPTQAFRDHPSPSQHAPARSRSTGRRVVDEGSE